MSFYVSPFNIFLSHRKAFLMSILFTFKSGMSSKLMYTSHCLGEEYVSLKMSILLHEVKIQKTNKNTILNKRFVLTKNLLLKMK